MKNLADKPIYWYADMISVHPWFSAFQCYCPGWVFLSKSKQNTTFLFLMNFSNSLIHLTKIKTCQFHIKHIHMSRWKFWYHQYVKSKLICNICVDYVFLYIYEDICNLQEIQATVLNIFQSNLVQWESMGRGRTLLFCDPTG